MSRVLHLGCKRGKIAHIGGKRYRLELATRAYPLNDQPADEIEMPKNPRTKRRA